MARPSHECEALVAYVGRRMTREDVPEIESLRFGPTITSIVTSDEGQTWYADNDEYVTPITFCPFCGVNLSHQ